MSIRNIYTRAFIKKSDWLSISLTILVWILILSDEFQIPLWKRLIGSSIFVANLILTYKVGRYYFPKLQGSPYSIVKLILWSALFAIVVGLQRLIFYEDTQEAIKENEPIYTAVAGIFAIAVLAVTITLLFSWTIYLFKRDKENQIAISNLAALNKESELAELKNQLNPHFLFNALSNIYSIAYLGDKRTPDKIMQLSKMLRYVIYDTDVKTISLSKEIEYLEHYIDFQKFKIQKEQRIEANFKDDFEDLKIAPLLLLPFIENAFKHSQIAVEKEAWVNINLQTQNGTLFFTTENSISSKDKLEILNNSGIGLENLKKRLELIYKDNFSLEITEKETYHIKLTIQTT